MLFLYVTFYLLYSHNIQKYFFHITPVNFFLNSIYNPLKCFNIIYFRFFFIILSWHFIINVFTSHPFICSLTHFLTNENAAMLFLYVTFYSLCFHNIQKYFFHITPVNSFLKSIHNL